MSALYKQTENSQELNNNFNTKNTVLDTTGCKSFLHHNIRIANNDLKRMTPSDFNIFCIMKIYNKYEYNAFEIENLLPIKQSRPTTLKEIESICDLQLASKRYKENKIGKTTKVSLNNVEPLHNYALINQTIIFDTNLNKPQKYWLSVMLIDDNDYINDPYYIKNFCNKKHKGKIKESTFREYLKVYNDNEYIKYNPDERDENNKFKRATITILPKARPFKNVKKHVDNINDNLKEKAVREKLNVIEETKDNDKINTVLGSDEPKTEFKNVFKELRKELGEGIYKNQIAKSHYEIKDDKLIVISQLDFIKDRIKHNHEGLILHVFNKNFNNKFKIDYKVDKDCIPNKELLVEDETSNIQPNVTLLDSKRKENNEIKENTIADYHRRIVSYKAPVIKIIADRVYKLSSHDVDNEYVMKALKRMAGKRGYNQFGNLNPGDYHMKHSWDFINTVSSLIIKELNRLSKDKVYAYTNGYYVDLKVNV